MNKPKVLVVEDEVLIALDLTMMLEDRGFEVIGPCYSAQQAFAALERSSPDVALLDYNLRDHTSEDLAEATIANRIPAAIITGLATRRLPPSLKSIPVISKPLTASALEELLDELLSKSST